MTAPFPVSKEPLKFEDLAVDLCRNTATRGGETVKLTSLGAEILYILAARGHQGAALFDFDLGLYGQLDAPNDLPNIIAIQICRLRKRLASIGVKIPGVGDKTYRLTLEPLVERAAA